MLIDLQGQTLRHATIVIQQASDTVYNGKVCECDIQVPSIATDLSKHLPDGYHQCVISYATSNDKAILDLCTGEYSLQEIAALCATTHGVVKRLIDSQNPEYYERRIIHKLMQSIDNDIAVFTTGKEIGILKACQQHGVSYSTYLARLSRYKRYNLWIA